MLTSVFHSGPIAEWVAPMVPGQNWEYPSQETWHCGGELWLAEFGWNGWLDCDGDGDLDLVATVTIWHEVKGIYYSGCKWSNHRATNDPAGIWRRQSVWFKNVGFNSRIRADINGDGRVDGSDLAAVLTNWGNTQ